MKNQVIIGVAILLSLRRVAGTAAGDGTFVDTETRVSCKDGSLETILQLTTPSLALSTDNSFICVGTHVPPGPDESYIVRMTSSPVPLRMFYTFSTACEEPGYRWSSSEPPVWDCSSSFVFGRRNPGLPSGPVCKGAKTVLIGEYPFVYNGGTVEDGSLILPHGVGMPVGGKTGLNYLVTYVHYPSIERATVNGTTLPAARTITLQQKTRDMQAANNVVLVGYGFVGPKSVGSVTAVYTLRHPDIVLHPVAVITHWHDKAIDVKVWISRTNGSQELLLQQDPHKFAGVTNITNWPATAVYPGDDLVIECTFNNTLSTPLHVQYREMCVANTFFTTDGAGVMETRFVASTDPWYSACLPPLSFPGAEVNEQGSSTFHATPGRVECA